MLTRVFKSGNSLAVRIPKELGFGEPMQEVEIHRTADGLVIRPVKRRKLTGISAKFSAFTEDYMTEGREFHEQRERDWS